MGGRRPCILRTVPWNSQFALVLIMTDRINTPIPGSNGREPYQELGGKTPNLEQGKTSWLPELTAHLCRELELNRPGRGSWECADAPDGMNLFKKSWKERWPLPQRTSPALHISLRTDADKNELVCNMVLEEDLILRHRVQIPYDLAIVFFDGPEIVLARVPLPETNNASGSSSPVTSVLNNPLMQQAVRKSEALNLLDFLE